MATSKSWFLSDKNQKRVLGIIIILLLCGIGFFYNKLQNKNVEIVINEQNQRALKDSVRVVTNKLGDIEYAKNILVSENNELKKLSIDLHKELKKEKGKVHQLNRLVVELKNKPNDTVVVENTVVKYPDGVVGLKFEHDTIFDTNNRRTFAGESKFKIIDNLNIKPMYTEITKDEVKFNLVTGLRQKGDNLEIFARSDYPGFEVIKLDGALIDPKKHPAVKKFTKQKRWGIGPYVGYGITKDGLTPSVGISIQYSIFKF